MSVILIIAAIIVLLIFWILKSIKKEELNRINSIDKEIEKWAEKFKNYGFQVPKLDFDKYKKVSESKNKYVRMKPNTYFITTFFTNNFRKIYYEKLSHDVFGKVFKYKEYFEIGTKITDINYFLKKLQSSEETGCSWITITDYKKEVLKTKTKETFNYVIWDDGVDAGTLRFRLVFDDGILVKQSNQ
jgi:hypothetical protein